jgi:hypothetical protein
MAYDRNPDDLYRPNVDLADDELQRMRLDRELQADPELGEGPASGGKVAMFAIAIAVVLGAVFYGLNNSSMNPAGTGQTTAQTQTSPAAPSGMRDVTPRNNTEPGMTTGAAPTRPAQPPASAPAGAEMGRSANPPPVDNPAPAAPSK